MNVIILNIQKTEIKTYYFILIECSLHSVVLDKTTRRSEQFVSALRGAGKPQFGFTVFIYTLSYALLSFSQLGLPIEYSNSSSFISSSSITLFIISTPSKS